MRELSPGVRGQEGDESDCNEGTTRDRVGMELLCVLTGVVDD